MCNKLGLKKFKQRFAKITKKEVIEQRKIIHSIHACNQYETILNYAIGRLGAKYRHCKKASKLKHIKKLFKYFNRTT